MSWLKELGDVKKAKLELLEMKNIVSEIKNGINIRVALNEFKYGTNHMKQQ